MKRRSKNHDRDDAATKAPRTPHDSLFKAGFEDPRHAGALLRQVAPPGLLAVVDWQSLALESSAFVEQSLRKAYGDLLFSAPLKLEGETRRVLFYMLVEHQSADDSNLLARINGYILRICERHRKRHGYNPLVVSAVVCHPRGGWATPTCLHEVFEPHPDEIPGLGRHVPNFAPLLCDLSKSDDETLKHWNMSATRRLIFWVLRDGRDPIRLIATLPAWESLIHQALASQDELAIFLQIHQYLKIVVKGEHAGHFWSTLNRMVPEVEEVVMTYADTLKAQGLEQGRAQGLEKGLEQGLEQGRAQMLDLLTELRFGQPLSSDHQVETKDLKQLQALLERLLKASSLEEALRN